MGTLNLWHLLVMGGVLVAAMAMIGALVWVILKAVNRPGARHRPPPQD